ncbi:MAG: exopolysaccharide biosynthesis polyprenyl glycosylphosphotransferase, partial [Nocardiopsaceae bacterium]|nr:exopolysaccharide biosynthesis polyprenyl glycosylphosphotransferase [Nocardiopsaceae bacterium]
PVPLADAPAAARHDPAAPARQLPRHLAGTAGRLVLTAGLPAADLLALAAAAALAGAWLLPAAGYAACVLVVLAATGQHRLKITPRVSDQAGVIIVAAMAALLVTLPVGPPGLAVRLALLAAGLVTAARAAGYAALRAARRRGMLTEPVLVVGAGQVGAELAGQLAAHPDLGLRPAGFLDSQPPVAGPPLPVLGRPAELAGVVSEHRIRRVIVAFPAGRDTDLVPAVRAARQLPADVCVVPRLHEIGTRVPRATADEVRGIPLIPLRRPGLAARPGKRAFDVLAAAILLLLLAPVLAVLSGLTRLQLRPVLFRQARITGTGRMAEIVKLRTLSRSGDPDTSWTAAPQRATRFGRLLRATHADELPQLVNVLRGEMSLVGPRPERPCFARRFEQEIPRYGDRHRMPAGVTGWAQVHGLVGDTSIRDRARFDNAYIENWTFWLDLVILARTVAAATAGLFTRRPDRRARQGLSAAGQHALPDSTLGGQE